MRKYAKKSIAFLLSMVLVLGLLAGPAVSTARADNSSADAQTKPLALAGKTSGTVTVDGVIDEAGWKTAERHSIEFLADFTISNNTAHFMTMWDDEYFYIAVNVLDEIVVGTQEGDWIDEENLFNNDGVEIFFDADNSKGAWDKKDDIQIIIRYDNEMVVFGGEGKAPWDKADAKYAEAIQHATRLTEDGFDVEVAIPWSLFDVTPSDGMVVGFDMTNDDNDNRTGNGRKEILWSRDHGYGNTSGYGTVCLYETRKPLIATEGTPVVKSGVANWNADIWNFSDEYSLAFPSENFANATVKFAVLCDSEALYLSMLAENVGAGEIPFAEIVLDGDYTRSGGIDSDGYGYIIQFYPTAAESWAMTTIAKGAGGTSKASYNLGDGSYATVIMFPWSLLTPADEDGNVIRQDHSLLSFSIAAGSGKTNPDNAAMGVWDDSMPKNIWTDESWNAWGGNALDNASTIIINNPNTIPTGNTAPTGTPYYAYSIQEGGTVSGKVNVTDADGDTLTYTVEAPEEGKGTVTVNETTGEWTYTAPAGLLTGTAPGVSFYIVANDNNEKDPQSFRTRVEVKLEHAPTNITYYVNGDTGSDSNDGLTEATALKTINAAHDKTNPGDTVIIHESKVPYGWYSAEEYAANPNLYKTVRDGAVAITRSGLPNAPITYKAAPGETPVIKANGVWDTVVISASYIVVDGLTVRGEADRLTYDDAWKAFWGKMAATDDPEYIATWDEPIGEVNTNAIGVAPAAGQKIEGDKTVTDPTVSIPHHITIRNCLTEFMGGSGIGGSQCDYVTFENCTAINNCWWGMYGNSGLGFIELVDIDDNTEDFKIVIRNCVSAGNRHFIPWKAGTVRLSDGNGIIMDVSNELQHNYQGKTLIANNLVYENGGSGIHAFRANNVYVVNNTIFNNNATVELTWGELFANDAKNMHMYNNIVYSRSGVAENPNADADKNGYNLFYNYRDNSVINDANGNILGVDPMFTNVVPVVHMPKGFDTATDYDDSWYETKTAAVGTNPNTWTKAGNAANAGWYPGAVYDVKTYGYDFTLRADSPAWGAASAEWQAIAGGAAYANTIGIFSEVGAGARVASYTDVDRDAWYYDAVNYVTAHGIMNGVGNNKFDPDGITTRGQLVTMLYRMEGEPTVTASSFSDVPAGQYYTEAVAWASAIGIVKGVGNNCFGPETEIKREDVAVILYRYAKYKGYDVTAAGDLSGYPDSDNVSSYAKDAMVWAVGAKLINDSDGKLIPGNFTIRAQMAQLLMNFCEKVA